MGIFSKTCEYGLRAVFYLAQKVEQKEKAGVKEIAKHIDSPEHFLSKILQSLSKKNVIKSMKGPNGGFYLLEEMLETNLMEVVIAIDGDGLFKGCAMGLKQCSSDHPCPLHSEFGAIRDNICTMLENTTIGQFNEELINGQLSLDT